MAESNTDARPVAALQRMFAFATAKRIAANAFADRKGHGGGPCTKRVLTEHQLRELLYEAARGAISQTYAYEDLCASRRPPERKSA